MATFDIAYMHPGTVKTEFASALIATAVEHPGTSFIPTSGKNLVLHKNIATQFWLDSSDKDWLLWVDSDLSWTQEGLTQLLETADEKGPSIVSGLVFQWSGTSLYPGFFVGRTSLGDLAIQANSWCEFPRDEPFKVPATGGGCVLIHREVLLAVEARPHTEGYPWYLSLTRADGKPGGYTAQLSEGASAEGYAIWVEPRSEFTHFEPVPITSELYDRFWGRQ